MNPTDLKKMRIKQVLLTNVFILVLIITYFSFISVLNITQTQLFFTIGILVLFQAIIGLLKGESTKSMIPIFEQVAKYEKNKMGREWWKQRRSNYRWNVILSFIMFLQAYLYFKSVNSFVHLDFGFMLSILFITIGVVNISLWMHIRKVDRAESKLD
jgi:uncharacterized membrane protein HdeD (DUF308 family)